MSSIGGIGGGGGGVQSILAMRQQIIERSNLLQQVKTPAGPEAPASGPAESFTGALKTALDGGIEEPAENVLIVATSNRRYLMPTMKADNNEFHWDDGELQAGESTEEKVSLSERFGLWLSFPAFSQDQYLDAVRLHLKALNGPAWSPELQVLALRWALNRASRSARVARQFAQDAAGRC